MESDDELEMLFDSYLKFVRQAFAKLMRQAPNSTCQEWLEACHSELDFQAFRRRVIELRQTPYEFERLKALLAPHA